MREIISNKILIFIAPFIILFFLSCSNCVSLKNENNINFDSKAVSLKNIISEKLGKNYSSKKNITNTHSILFNDKIQNSSHFINKLKFLIVDLKLNEIIFEDELNNADIKWISENLVEVCRIPGIIKKDKDGCSLLYRFDVINKIKTNN